MACSVWLAKVSVVAIVCGVAHPAAAQSVSASNKWSATLLFRGSRGGGDVRVEPGKKDGESRVRLSLRTMPINTQVAWDVVAGSCGDEGRPAAAAAAFRQVLIGNDGAAMVSATIPRLTPGQRYYVRVFDPSTPPIDAQVFVCANLSEEQ
ncbi:MAG: hypothetical protein MUF00_13090 [Gemmatimonadaceae bacterium]|nr:hypothetical protein [Gemmatimonadaceae bacterium]